MHPFSTWSKNYKKKLSNTETKICFRRYAYGLKTWFKKKNKKKNRRIQKKGTCVKRLGNLCEE
jgi:hypothetical protein